MRMRKKPNLIPRLARCGAIWIQDPENLRGRWRELHSPGCPLHVELGCGKGRFTAEIAAANPEILFVAVERVPEAMVVAMERVTALGLSNVFFLSEDAARLPDFFAPDEVNLIYINFCDPWPGNRHAKRRLTFRSFLMEYRKVLRIGGEIRFKTDNRPLFDFSLDEFPAAGFRISSLTYNLHSGRYADLPTDYEAKFFAAGTPICRLVAVQEADRNYFCPIL
ncbi:MAG: tRNA (guanosine(46)-N7)-methyltransferase TrmB [Oscillospiraceae bacterium]|nr:tRNA (guanosine(46)-N7)-methyltransferase TrmB [Oscillospiraceae bacterium]